MLNMQSGQEVKLTKREGGREIEGGGGVENIRRLKISVDYCFRFMLMQVIHSSAKNIVYFRIRLLRYKKTSNKHQLNQQIRVRF